MTPVTRSSPLADQPHASGIRGRPDPTNTELNAASADRAELNAASACCAPPAPLTDRTAEDRRQVGEGADCMARPWGLVKVRTESASPDRSTPIRARRDGGVGTA